MPMKYIISMLLLLSTLQVIAQEWSTYQYQDKYFITIPPTMELRRENDTYTQLLDDIQGNIIGFQVTSTSNNRVIFQQAGLSTNKHEYKTKYCRILIDYYTCEDEHPCSGDKLELNEEYFTNGVIAIQQDCESTKTPLMTIISNDTMTIADSPATKIIYRRQGYNGATPVIVAIYTIFNYNEYVRITMSFREAEQDIWMQDLIKARKSFKWMQQHHNTSIISYISKDEAVKEGLELGIITVWKVILEIILGCCCLGYIIRTKKNKQVTTAILISEEFIDIPNKPLYLIQDRIPKTGIKKRLWKVGKKLLLSLVIMGSGFAICVQMKELYYELNCLFYYPFYLIIEVYYLYLLWRKRDVLSEDVVLYPLLKKIGIYSDISDHYLLRKALLATTVPLLLSTIIISLLVVSIDSISPKDDGEVSIGSFILSLPVIAWIVFFAYVYGKKWLDNTSQL